MAPVIGADRLGRGPSRRGPPRRPRERSRFGLGRRVELPRSLPELADGPGGKRPVACSKTRAVRLVLGRPDAGGSNILQRSDAAQARSGCADHKGMSEPRCSVVPVRLLAGLCALFALVGVMAPPASSTESITETFNGTLAPNGVVYQYVDSGVGNITVEVACSRRTRVNVKIMDPSNSTLANSTKRCTSDGFSVSTTAASVGKYSFKLSERLGYSTGYTLKVTHPAPATTTTTVTSTTTTTTSPRGKLSLNVSGKHLVNGAGTTLQLRGVNYSGAEYACVGDNGTNGYAIWDGPADQSLISAFKTWNINAVRLPLNETCWLGINGVNPEYSGENYRAEIARFVQLLTDNGIYPVLDLHWSAPGTWIATKNRYMPNRDHSPEFWRSVGARFKDNPAVVFDVFNEPRAVSWSCWRDGGCQDIYGNGWTVAGMQELLNAVRSSGASNVVTVPGLGYASDLSQWLSYKPSDPQNQLAASFHVYDFSSCNTISCWDTEVAPVAASVPVVSTELGQGGCTHEFIDGFMTWADSKEIAYLGWTWNTWDCGGGPALVSSLDGTPTLFGIGFKDHLTRVN